jgi:hypothetical protein
MRVTIESSFFTTRSVSRAGAQGPLPPLPAMNARLRVRRLPETKRASAADLQQVRNLYRVYRYRDGSIIKPGVGSTSIKEDQPSKENSGNGDGPNDPPGLHPFVQGLLKELPKAGDVWPEDQRKLWLDTAASIFEMIYKDQPLPKPPYRNERGRQLRRRVAVIRFRCG